MIQNLFAPLSRLQIASPADLLDRVGRWWLAEFLTLCPSRFAEWLAGRDRKALIVSLDGDCVCLRLEGDGRRPLDFRTVRRVDYSPASIDDFLTKNRLKRGDIDLGLRLPTDQYFRRTFPVPAAAHGSIADVAVQDLARKTPFRLHEVFHDFSTSRPTRDKILVTQWVTRRTFVDDAATALELTTERVSFLDADIANENVAAPFIRLHRERSHGKSWLRTAGLALVLCAVILAILVTGLKFWRQQLLLDELESQLTMIKPKVQHVRAQVGALERKQGVTLRIRDRKRQTVRLLDAWEETTRILPNHSWLVELRLIEGADGHLQQIGMTGYSTAAPSLVGLIDASPMFLDASLTSPIARDNVEDRERFSIQATLRPRVQAREAP